MPIHLPPLNRRRFLAGALAAGAGLVLPRCHAAQQSLDPDSFVLLADLHICEDRDKGKDGVKPATSFEQAGREILALATRPAGAIVAGDCAFNQGLPGDYTTLGELIEPLRKAGLPMHFALGNHDHRENFLTAFPESRSDSIGDSVLPGKLVSVLETPHANWFLLDSLTKTNVTPGALGEAQLAWLAKAIDARPDKPALVLAHHNPDQTAKPSGLTGTEAFFELLAPRRQVKAYFFGHTHCWNLGRQQDLHLVNVPAAAWLFDKTQPRGFITARLRPDGATLVLHALDRQHAKHGETIDLKWRT
jgi:3',5'-cyclic-AMP phosphodiesterase